MRPELLLLLSLCLCVAVVLSASAVTAPAAQAASTGSITGTVTDASGNPLAGIDVTAYQSDGSGDWEWASQVTTASDGSYLISGLSAGVYHVEFSDPNGIYPSQFYDSVAALAGDSATPVDVTDGATTPGIDAALTPGGHITGTVTDFDERCRRRGHRSPGVRRRHERARRLDDLQWQLRRRWSGHRDLSRRV